MKTKVKICCLTVLLLMGTLVPLAFFVDNTIIGTSETAKFVQASGKTTRTHTETGSAMSRCDLSDKNLPMSGNSSSCEVIHVCIICIGYDDVRDTTTLIKSLLFSRTNVIHFHFIADLVSLPILKTLLRTWALPSVQHSFYSTPPIFNKISGLMKLQIPSILPPTVDKVIFLDINVIFSTNIVDLWKHFSAFQPTQMLGLAKQPSDGDLSNTIRWPTDQQGYHTGVILMMANRIRESKLWRETIQKYSIDSGSIQQANEDVINKIIKNNNGIAVYMLPCVGNVQMLTQSCLSTSKVFHISSQHNQQATHGTHTSDYARESSDFYSKVIQYDGRLLKNEPVKPTCNYSEPNFAHTRLATEEPAFVKQTNSSACTSMEGFWEGSKGRLHLYYIPYNYRVQNGDVTLVTQLSFERLEALEKVSKYWPGPMSLSLYMNDSEAQGLVAFVHKSPVLRKRQNIGYHVIFKNGVHYPINYMRNVALNNSRTTYVFLTDIDFIPGIETYEHVKSEASLNNIHEKKLALVIPAFETRKPDLDMPSTKQDLRKLIDAKTVMGFKIKFNPPGHRPTNYTRWYNSTESYPVVWQPKYEPYMVVRRDILPWFDERFVDYGWNKISQMMEMDAQGFELLVVPNAFMIHLPHAQTPSDLLFRNNEVYQQCFATLTDGFRKYLLQRYGPVAKKYLFKDSLRPLTTDNRF